MCEHLFLPTFFWQHGLVWTDFKCKEDGGYWFDRLQGCLADKDTNKINDHGLLLTGQKVHSSNKILYTPHKMLDCSKHIRA